MKTIAHLIPYAPFPPKGGGALRCVNIALQTARFCQTKVILFQTHSSVIESGMEIPTSMEIISPLDSPPAKDIFNFIPKGNGLRYRWLRRSWAGPSNSIVGQTHHILQDLLSKQKIDAVILEHLEGMTLAPLIKRLSPKTRIILDAHNVDHLLFKQENEARMSPDRVSSKELRKKYQRIEETEKSLSKHIDAFWACSDIDRNILEDLNVDLPGYTIPNGVDCAAMTFRNDSGLDHTAPIILFCGSLGYESNRDGLNWFANECWPLIKAELPSVRLCVVGQGGQRDDYRLLIQDSNVDFIGEVESTLSFYQKANISICPLRIGSGTRLKVLETLSVGTPCVTTPLGCEGIELIDREHALLASNADEFASQCIHLINEKKLAEYISEKGRKFVEERYDWPVIGEMMNKSIEEICESQDRRY